MPEIILHIGCHKTGTTALQDFLSLNEEVLLRREGILYPRTGRDTHKPYHHPVFRDVIVSGQRMNSGLVRDILAEGASRGASRILLSSEILSRMTITTDELHEIHDSFKGNRISIIVYLRRQYALLQSMYAERVKRGLLAAPDTIHDIAECLDYYIFIKKYAEVFGGDAINIRIYEDAVRKGIFRDFLETLGASLDPEYTIRENRSNERLPWIYIELLRYANTASLGRRIVLHPVIRRPIIKLGQLFPFIMDHPKPLTDHEREAISDKYYKSNNRLAKEYNICEELYGLGK